MIKKTILVAGATGETGRIIVRKLIKQGYPTSVFVRDVNRAKKMFGKRVDFFEGDVRAPETILPAMQDVDTVISAIGTRVPVGKNCPKRIDYLGVVNLVNAACQAGVQRFILISSVAVTNPDHPMNRFGQVLSWKWQGEEALRTSDMNYTIIRPGGLKNTKGGQKGLKFDQGDRILGMVSRADVAEVCLQALNHPQSHCTTFEVIESDQPATVDWAALFSMLKGGCAT